MRPISSGQESSRPASGRHVSLAPAACGRDNAAMEADPPKTNPPKRKRRWFQFSLRTLFVVVTLIAAACWVVIDRRRLIRERDESELKAEQAVRTQAELNTVIGWWSSKLDTADRDRQVVEKRADRAEKLLHFFYDVFLTPP
jgi:cytoskeletal protein RodZ